jgi:hypothetical protein
MKTGHYLVITKEMKAIRQNTLVCGFCGFKATKGEYDHSFCNQCLGSVYLKEVDLCLLRMLPVSLQEGARRGPLSPQEQVELKAAYVLAQTRTVQGDRKEVLDKYDAAVSKAAMERDGMLWLINQEIPTDNVLFYSHSGGYFGFGWRHPVSKAVASELQEKLKGFPSRYEIRQSDD